MTAVSAGVSVVSGVAGLISKSKQASAQRKQLEIQQQQNYDSSVAAMRRLELQQMQAEREYAYSDIQFKQAAQQQEAGLNTQGLLAVLETQRAKNTLAQQSASREVSEESQRSQLQRQAVALNTGASSQRQQSDAALAQVLDQLTNAQGKIASSLGEEDLRRLAQRTMYESRSSSGRTQESANNLRKLALAMSASQDIDANALEAATQAANEKDLVNISEGIAGNDLAAMSRSLEVQSKAADIGNATSLGNLDSNLNNQLRALDTARGQLDFNTQLRNRQEAEVRQNSLDNYNLNQESIAKTGQYTSDALASQKRSVAGVNILDLIATGGQAYNAISPLITRNSTPTPSGAPSYLPKNMWDGPSYIPKRYSGDS